MLRDALFLARKDLRHFVRLPQVWIWTIVMPLALSYVVGSLMPFANGIGRDRIALWAPAKAGFLADEVARRLSAAGFQVVRVADPARLKQNLLSLSIPDGFTDSVLQGPPAEIELTSYAYGIQSAYDRYRVQRAVYSVLGDLVVLSKLGHAPQPADFAALASQPRKITLRVESAGNPKVLVLGFQQAVPGFIVMFTLLVSLNAGGMLLVVERRLGILRRLASTRVSRGAVVGGKLLALAAVGLVQVGFAMIAGTYVFGVYWGGRNLWAVALLLGAYLISCSALALLAGTLARSEGQSQAIGIITTMVLASLGGCWWPIEITPPWMRQFSMLLPTGWAMDGLHKLLSYGAAPVSILPHIAALLSLACLAGWISYRRFRFE
jgi:ABC-type multidrug transport system permease subunit